jgi:GTP cyclohydrolase I
LPATNNKNTIATSQSRILILIVGLSDPDCRATDDPEREGLIDTPARVGRAWREYCAGYAEDPGIHLRRTFSEVVQCIRDNLQPQGVAVVIEAQHDCMTGRGMRTPGVEMITSRMQGCFLDDASSRKELLCLMGRG